MILPALLRDVLALGHVVFTEGELNLNLIGQRSSSRRAGELDDLLSVVYRERGRWLETAWPCSLDPGRRGLARPPNPRGTAILAPGQYRGAYELGLHKGRRCLRQVKPVTVRRDGDLDELLEPGDPDTGMFGIHVHDDAGVGAEASEGCTVLARDHMAELVALVDRAASTWGSRVTYTVVDLA